MLEGCQIQATEECRGTDANSYLTLEHTQTHYLSLPVRPVDQDQCFWEGRVRGQDLVQLVVHRLPQNRRGLPKLGGPLRVCAVGPLAERLGQLPLLHGRGPALLPGGVASIQPEMRKAESVDHQ